MTKHFFNLFFFKKYHLLIFTLPFKIIILA